MWFQIFLPKKSDNIQGYRRNIFTYIVLTLLNPIIIRLLWIRKDNIIIKPATNTLIINSDGLTISIKITPVLSEIKELITAPFTILIKGARKRVRFFRVKISENHTSRISLSREGVTEESTMELEVVCDLSPLLCV